MAGGLVKYSASTHSPHITLIVREFKRITDFQSTTFFLDDTELQLEAIISSLLILRLQNHSKIFLLVIHSAMI